MYRFLKGQTLSERALERAVEFLREFQDEARACRMFGEEVLREYIEEGKVMYEKMRKYADRVKKRIERDNPTSRTLRILKEENLDMLLSQATGFAR